MIACKQKRLVTDTAGKRGVAGEGLIKYLLSVRGTLLDKWLSKRKDALSSSGLEQTKIILYHLPSEKEK